MISLNNSLLSSPSSAVTREGAVAEWFQTQSNEVSGGKLSKDARFSWQVLELDATFPEALRPYATTAELDFPSVYAMGIARSLCYDVDRIIDSTVSFADVEAFEGDLLIHWRSSDRWMTLICPSGPDRKAKLYREELHEGKLLKSDVALEPQASDVASAIRWVWGAT